jgi:hypothetical protein
MLRRSRYISVVLNVQIGTDARVLKDANGMAYGHEWLLVLKTERSKARSQERFRRQGRRYLLRRRLLQHVNRASTGAALSGRPFPYSPGQQKLT